MCCNGEFCLLKMLIKCRISTGVKEIMNIVVEQIKLAQDVL